MENCLFVEGDHLLVNSLSQIHAPYGDVFVDIEDKPAPSGGGATPTPATPTDSKLLNPGHHFFQANYCRCSIFTEKKDGDKPDEASGSKDGGKDDKSVVDKDKSSGDDGASKDEKKP